MRFWKIKRWIGIKLGRICPRCHADLKLVYTCGICGRGGVPIQTVRAQPPRLKRVTYAEIRRKWDDSIP